MRPYLVIKSILSGLIRVLFPFVFSPLLVFGQASFSIPDTVCVDEPINIINTSIGGNNFSWNFCELDSFDTFNGTNLGSFPYLKTSSISDLVYDNNNYYLFVTEYNPPSIVRLDFGVSPLNTPTSNNLKSGGILPIQLEGIQIEQDQGSWYGFVVGSNKLIRLDFGSSISNTPSLVDLGNVGSMSWPHDYKLVKDGSNWIGIAANRGNERISIHNFGTSLSNTPTGSSFFIPGPTDLSHLGVVQEGGKWYVFATALFGPSLIRLDFGTSLLNVPSQVNLGNLGGVLNPIPRSIILVKNCNQFYGFIGHENGNTVKLNFKNGINSMVSAVNLGQLYGTNQRHPIISYTPLLFGGELILFSTTASSNILRARIPLCTSSITPTSNTQPQTYSYTSPGTYSVSLSVNTGSYDQSTKCKKIQVVDTKKINLGADTILCNGQTITLDATTKNATYLWQDGSTNSSLTVSKTGRYWVNVLMKGCSYKDTIQVDTLPPILLDLGENRSICPNEEILLDATNANAIYQWQDQSSNPTLKITAEGVYSVLVSNSCETKSDTVIITSKVCNCNVYIPNIFTPNNDGINDLFLPKSDCIFSKYELIIFNRWGEKVFKTASQNIDWDGTYQGKEVPDGTYMYLLRYKPFSEPYKALKGNLTLIR